MIKLIKWTLKTVFIFTGILLLLKCSSGYREKDGKITFNGREITDSNFTILSDEFAKDDSAVYYKEHEIIGADIGSFQALDIHYAKDKYKVYYCDEYREGQNYYLTKRQTVSELTGALPASFSVIGNGYAKDLKRAYFEGWTFSVKDLPTLTSVNRQIARDKLKAYVDLKVIPQSDGKSFEIIAENFAKDSLHIYYFATVSDGSSQVAILPCDPATFRVIDYRYSKDRSKVFFLGFTIAGADPASFVVLEEGYSKDKLAVYFQEKKIAADPASFAVYKENGEYGHDVAFAADAINVFMDDKIIRGAKPANFKVLGENYASDSIQVYYKKSIVKKAQQSSFKVYPHDVGNADAEDAQRHFHEGIEVEKN